MIGMLSVPNLLAWSLQVALLVAAALVTLRLVRLEEPAVKYAVLRAVLVLCLTLPVLGVLLPASRDAATAAVESGTAASSVDAGVVAGPLYSGLPAIPAAPALTFLLVAGVLARLGWLATGIGRLRALRRAGEAAAFDAAHDELQRLVDARADIRYVRGLGQPVTFGFRSPVILLPESLLDQHPAIQRAVLAHELWHVRRRDWMWSVVEEALRALLWFHPAIWILLSRIQAVREEVVDQLAILSTGSRRSYVDALLAYVDARPLFTGAAFARRRHLMHRLLLISTEAVMSARRIVGSCAVVALVALSTGWYGARAFPLVQTQGPLDGLSGQPGPVEQRAKPITPENPIPRRTHYVEPDYPSEALPMQARATVTMQVALDETGHLAETRIARFAMGLRDSQLSFGLTAEGSGARGTLESLVSSLPASERDGVRRAAEAFMRSAIRAVRQWQYDRPFDGPIAFPVVLTIAPPGDASASALPPVEAAQQVDPDGTLRVGGNIKAPTKIRHVNPVYPAEAKAAGVQGIVIIEARIETDGSVGRVRVLRSVPMLDEAAVEAVRQWQFVPTLLNGQPVPVLMTMTVNFTLQ